MDFLIAPIFGAGYHAPKIGALSMAEEPEFRPQAKVSWCAQDIMDQYQCTQEEAEAFLEEIEDDLQLAMIATGWRVIHGLSEFPRRVGESGLTLPPHIVLQFRIGF